jgi:hypothetical protein
MGRVESMAQKGAIMTPQVEQAETGMELRDLFEDPEFPRRKRQARDAMAMTEPFRLLAHVFAENPEIILQKLVDLAVEFCGADSAGISLEEPNEAGEMRFRWVAVAGSFAQYVNGTTPRFFSPCGTTLNRRAPQLYRVTKPYYDYLGITAEPIKDGILIPWEIGGTRGTIWAVSHRSHDNFDLEDYKLLDSLADFVAIGLRYQLQQKALAHHERNAAFAAIANDLAHQINNPLQALTNSVYLAAQHSTDGTTYLQQAKVEIERISELVSRLLTLADGGKRKAPAAKYA